MGQARLKLKATGGTPVPQPPRVRLGIYVTQATMTMLQEGYTRLTQAQLDRKLPVVSMDVFLEHMLMAGLERLAQSIAGSVPPPVPDRRILTPAEAAMDMRGRRTIGAPAMMMPGRKT